MALMFATVARNEDAYIAEWLAFHILYGVDAFLVFDNDSDDTTPAIARQFGLKHNVRVIPWPTPQGANFVAYQEAAYKLALNMATDEGMDWLMFTDIDEFTFGENNSTLSERLDAINDGIGAVAIRPYDFGSNFRLAKPSKGLVIENFQRSVTDSFALAPGFFKSISRPKCVLGMEDTPHAVLLKHGARYGYPDGSPVEQSTIRPGIANNPKIGGILQHHYITKSRAEFDAKRARYTGKTRKIGDDYFVNREQVCNAVERSTLVRMADRVRTLMAEAGHTVDGGALSRNNAGTDRSMSYAASHAKHINEAEARISNAYKCLRLVHQVSPFRSVVDFGCGIGGWLVAAKQLGAQKILGLEGEWIKGRETLLDTSEITICDLAKDIPRFGRSFDLAVSIEVAEHLPCVAADRFCDALVDASDLVVFSAAIPGQGGDNHVNEQKPKYWVDRFWQRGFAPLEMVRPGIINDPTMFPWLKQNVMVFCSYPQLCVRPALKQYMMPREYFYHRFRSM